MVLVKRVTCPFLCVLMAAAQGTERMLLYFWSRNKEFCLYYHSGKRASGKTVD